MPEIPKRVGHFSMKLWAGTKNDCFTELKTEGENNTGDQCMAEHINVFS